MYIKSFLILNVCTFFIFQHILNEIWSIKSNFSIPVNIWKVKNVKKHLKSFKMAANICLKTYSIDLRALFTFNSFYQSSIIAIWPHASWLYNLQIHYCLIQYQGYYWYNTSHIVSSKPKPKPRLFIIQLFSIDEIVGSSGGNKFIYTFIKKITSLSPYWNKYG